MADEKDLLIGMLQQQIEQQNTFIYATDPNTELEALKNRLLNREYDPKLEKWVTIKGGKQYCNERFVNAVLVQNFGYANKVSQQSNFPGHIIKATLKRIMKRISIAICYYYEMYGIDKVDRLFIFDACWGLIEGALYRTENDKERDRWKGGGLQLREALAAMNTKQEQELIA